MNKKWKVIAAVVVVVVIAVACLFIFQNNSNNEEEITEEDLFPQIQEIESAPEIEVSGEDGLQLSCQINKEHWENLGALSLLVTIKNTSDEKLIRAALTQTLFNKNGAVIGFEGAKVADVPAILPGEKTVINLDMISATPDSIGKVEISFREGTIVWEESSPPEVNSSGKESEGEGNTAYVENPKEPDEVVAAFYFLLFEEKYLEAGRLIEQAEAKIDAGELTEGDIEGELGSIRRLGVLEGIETESVSYSINNKDTANVTVILSFEGGKKEPFCLEVVKEDGKWKIALSNF